MILRSKTLQLQIILLKSKKELAHFTAKVNKERKNEEKKLKKRGKIEFLDNLKANSLAVELECDKCDAKSESLQKLKSHETTNSAQTDEKKVEDKTVQHSRSELLIDIAVQTLEENIDEAEVTQEESFEKYPCFYCGINIASDYHLSEHGRKCRGTTKLFGVVGRSMPFTFSPGFPPPPNLSPFGFNMRKKQPKIYP